MKEKEQIGCKLFQKSRFCRELSTEALKPGASSRRSGKIMKNKVHSAFEGILGADLKNGSPARWALFCCCRFWLDRFSGGPGATTTLVNPRHRFDRAVDRERTLRAQEDLRTRNHTTKENEVMNNKFDELTKSMAQPLPPRGAVKKFGVGLASMALACTETSKST